jgi:molybdate transport system substrate-binding protein
MDIARTTVKTFNLIFIASIIILNISAAQAADINVFAAASMKGALDEIGAAFKTKSGKSIVATYAATGTLAKQIEASAPADVFISADEVWMDYLAAKKLIKDQTRQDIAGNTLVLIHHRDDSVVDEILQLEPLKRFQQINQRHEKLALADINSVPAGKYAKQALEKLGLWNDVKNAVVMQDNVRAALALVARGEVEWGIVYGTDAKAAPMVEVPAIFPEDSHAPILYPAAVIAASRNAEAEKFVSFLKGPEAEAIFRRDGFEAVK